MGIFRQFPYTNFHELNLDEMIKIVRQLADDWVEYQLKWDQLYTDVDTAFEAFKADFEAHIAQYDSTFNSKISQYDQRFDTFMDNLNPEQGFRTALDSIIADGTLNEIISPTIVSTTNAWLTEHITQPTTPVVDSSLSIEGAAADAARTGYFVNDILWNLFRDNSYDILHRNAEVTDNTRNGVTYTWNQTEKSVTMTGTASPASFCNLYFNTERLPIGMEAGSLIEARWNDANSMLNFIFYKNGALLSQRNVIGAEIVKVPADAQGCVIRVYVNSGSSVNNTVRPMVLRQGYNFNLKYLGVPSSSGYTLNTMPANTISFCNGNEANLPLSTGGFLITLGNIAKCQIYIVASRGRAYYRYATTSGVDWRYGAWNDLPTDWAYLSGSLAYQGMYAQDLNDTQSNTIVVTDGTATNAPVEGSGFCLTTGAREYPGVRIQLFIRFLDGAMYYRRSTNGTWTEWSSSNSSGNISAKLLSFGNSILSGSVWTSDSGSDTLGSWGNAPYSVIANGLNIPKENTNHTLLSSTGLLYNAGDGSFLTNIKNTSISTYDAILTHLWIQDMNNYPLGSLDSQANDGSIVGGVLELLRYMKANNPRSQLILCSVPPCSTTIKGNSVFTGNYQNGKSINDLDVVMRQLAAREHFIYIDWQELNMSYYYQDLTWNHNNVHLASEDSYRVLGAYAAGRVARQLTF